MANPNPPNQWPVGKSGNPKGAPKKPDSLTGLLRAYLNEPIGEDEDGSKRLRKESFVKAAVLHAVKGDATILKYLWDRLDGQMKQEILMETKHISVKPAPPPDFEDTTSEAIKEEGE